MRIASFDVESLFDRAKRSTNGHGPRAGRSLSPLVRVDRDVVRPTRSAACWSGACLESGHSRAADVTPL